MLLAERATGIAHAGTQGMNPHILSGRSVLVVEGKSDEGTKLRSSLVRLGAAVHVVGNVHTAMMLMKRKRIDGAILDCVEHGASLPLCSQLAELNVPFMYYGGVLGGGTDDTAGCMAELISVANTASHEWTSAAGRAPAETGRS